MKIEVGEEISKEEFNKLLSNEVIVVNILSESGLHYYKKAQKFPIVFEDENKIINVYSGGIDIKKKDTNDLISFDYKQSFPLLVKAVEKAKEVMKKE